MDLTAQSGRLAILFQAERPPAVDGIEKPFKEGGYSDSGADIGYNLSRSGVDVITPSGRPRVQNQFDWVFPDTRQGIEEALAKGANTIWLNTVLFESHPILGFRGNGLMVVGQNPMTADLLDNKYATNLKLRTAGLPVVESKLLNNQNSLATLDESEFPLVMKPIRGRGSQGVQRIDSLHVIDKNSGFNFPAFHYGNTIMIEPFLSGPEITVTVMPPGIYRFGKEILAKPDWWALPAVSRFNHVDGVAPYNGVVAIVHNSRVIDDNTQHDPTIANVRRQCELAARLVESRAPVRIDCRQNEDGEFLIFDVNLKPNMTGPGRPGRDDQDSLTALAARAINWDYPELLQNILLNAWEL